MGGSGDSQVLVDGNRFTIYDAGRRTVYTGDLPQDKRHPDSSEQPPTLADVQKKLARVMEHASLSGAQPSDVAGRAAYTVRISPKENGGLLDGAELAWDAANGVPLRAAVYAKGSGDPVLELEATDISFGKVDPSVFAITPPPDAKVVDLAPKADAGGIAEKPVEGISAVQAELPFQLAAPDTLAGKPRTTVRLISSDRHAAALVTYGDGLDGLAVIQTQAGPDRSGGQDGHGGVSLPNVRIGSAQGTELPTPLGTVVSFDRGGVTFVVLGSAPAATVQAAAAQL
jgi:hypothetical protein